MTTAPAAVVPSAPIQAVAAGEAGFFVTVAIVWGAATVHLLASPPGGTGSAEVGAAKSAS